MEFDGTFTIDDVTREEVWLALSDPVVIQQALPGCQFLVEVDDPDAVDFDSLEAEAPDEQPPVLPETDPATVAARSFEEGHHYAAVMQISVGKVQPQFNTVVTVSEREFPRMGADGEGAASSSSFEMAAEMHLTTTNDGVDVEWRAEADVFGRIAQLGGRMLNPVANRVVNRFFGRVEDQLHEVSNAPPELRNRIREHV